MEIDDKLKNRLAGATVVTVLAIIFLPMLFDDPVEKQQQIVSELTLPHKPEPSPLLTSAIIPDSTTQVVQKPVVAAIAKRPVPASVARVAQKPPPVKPNNELTEEEKNLEITIPKPKLPVAVENKIKPPVVKVAETEPTPAVATGSGKRWVIQVASLSDQSKAEAFRDKLRAQGFSATMEPVTIKGRQVYRLRVGPELDAQRADETKAKINQLNNVKSILLPE
jgi:DedD protein